MIPLRDSDAFWFIILVTSSDFLFTYRYPSAIYPTIPDTEKRRIQEQHDARTGNAATLLSIFMTNSMESGKGAAVFQIAARFNHSCVPNAHFAWCEKLGVETIFAVSDIGVDEEITLSYCDPTYDPSMRKWELKHYGFECDCKACVDMDIDGSFASKSRERRWLLRDNFDILDYQADPDKKLRLNLECAKMMNEEGMCTPNLGQM
jgi:hypothetical protein